MNKITVFWGCLGIVNLTMTFMWGLKGDMTWTIYSLVWTVICIGGVVSMYKTK